MAGRYIAKTGSLLRLKKTLAVCISQILDDTTKLGIVIFRRPFLSYRARPNDILL